jgi:hypothetical protein
MRSHEFISESTVGLMNRLELSIHDDYVVVYIPVDKNLKTETSTIYIENIAASISIVQDDFSYSPLLILYDLTEYSEYESGRLAEDDTFEKNIKKFLINFGFPSELISKLSFNTIVENSEGEIAVDADDLIEYLKTSILDFLMQTDPQEITSIIKEHGNVILYLTVINKNIVNACKADIIRYCLGEFKESRANNAIAVVNKLKASGINWPEFAAMEKSAGALGK